MFLKFAYFAIVFIYFKHKIREKKMKFNLVELSAPEMLNIPFQQK